MYTVGYLITEMNVKILQKYQIYTDIFVSIPEYIFKNDTIIDRHIFAMEA